MKPEDLDQMMVLSETAHPDLPERRATQEQRLKLFPPGCWVLKEGATLYGYAFAHPIRHGSPPALDAAPTQIDGNADTLYLHDFVVAPALRGRGYAAKGIAELLRVGNAFTRMALISVYGTTGLWSKYGFAPCTAVSPEKLTSYGADAVYMTRANAREATAN